MPVTKSAGKQMRVAERRQIRHKPIRTLCRTRVSQAETLIFSGELETAAKAVITAISALDKAAQKGIIHPNNAARRRSRLMKKLNQARASSLAKAG